MKKINWQVFYESQAPLLKGVCRRYVKDVFVAEDMVHNAFETAISKIETFKGSGSFEGWLRRIAINKCLQYLRNQKVQTAKSDVYKKDILEEMKVDNEYQGEGQAAFSKEALLKVIDELPHQHKLVFNLYVLDGYKHHEIATLLDISTGTSKSCLSRARKKAKEMLLENTANQQFKTISRNSWLLLLFLRFNFIDIIFKKGLAGYALSAATTPILVSITNTSSLPWMSAITAKVVGWSIAALVVVPAGVIINQHVQMKTPDHIEYLATEMDTIQHTNKDTLTVLISEPNFETTIKELKTEKPKVVIRKQKIIRDTVYVQK